MEIHSLNSASPRMGDQDGALRDSLKYRNTEDYFRTKSKPKPSKTFKMFHSLQNLMRLWPPRSLILDPHREGNFSVFELSLSFYVFNRKRKRP